MSRRIFLTLTVLMAFVVSALIMSTGFAAEKSEWIDKNYNFKAIRSAVINPMDFDGADIESDIIQRELNEIYMEEAKAPKYMMLTAAPDEAAFSMGTISIGAELVAYEIVSRLIPAHWETKYKDAKERYRDKDGKWREREVQIPYQEYVPDKYVDDSRVTLRFRAVDVTSGEEVFLREESRLHSDSTNRKGVFKRICKTFFSDLKKKMK